jgi:hypothetical protein
MIANNTRSRLPDPKSSLTLSKAKSEGRERPDVNLFQAHSAEQMTIGGLPGTPKPIRH